MRAAILPALEPSADTHAGKWFIGEARKYMEVGMKNLLPTYPADIPAQVKPIRVLFLQRSFGDTHQLLMCLPFPRGEIER